LLYAGLATLAIAVQWVIYHETASYPPAQKSAIIFTSSIVVDAIVAAIVYAQAKGDIDGWTSSQVWLRVLDRLWAVVVVDFIVNFVTLSGIAPLSEGDLLDRVIAIPILLIAAGTVFADAIAVVVDDERWWFLVIRAIGTSLRTSWSGATLRRAIVLFALQFVPLAMSSALTSISAQHHVSITSFWSDVPAGILFSIPLNALIVLAFFDASGYEPKRTCGE
jgi:hypothetical protein